MCVCVCVCILFKIVDIKREEKNIVTSQAQGFFQNLWNQVTEVISQ